MSTLKTIADIPSIVDQCGNINKDRFTVMFKYNDPNHHTIAHYHENKHWQIVNFILDEDNEEEEQIAYGSFATATDNDDVTWRVFEIMED